MFAFRSAIRKLFGVSIPNIDSVSADSIIINDLRSSLAEAEDERTEFFIDSIISEATSIGYRDGIVSAIEILMNTLGVTKVTIEKDEDEDLDEEV